jgi:thioredoxin reductase
MDENHDVVVVGGGAAGLSGAVALARSRRSVLVVDAGDPRNGPAGHVHNFLTRDGTPPAELYAAGRGEVTRYGGRVETGRVTALSRDGERFAVQIGRRSVTARRLLVTTGVRDELPDVPGLAARWGIDVLHCAYCHGWEVRDKRIGVLATGPTALHQALLFRQLGPTGATAVPGVWVAGNLTDIQAQVITAAAAGLTAGAAINFDLVLEETRPAVGAGS